MLTRDPLPAKPCCVRTAARIFFLKPGAETKQGISMQLMGERLDVMKAITMEWLKQDKVEPCEGA